MSIRRAVVLSIGIVVIVVVVGAVLGLPSRVPKPQQVHHKPLQLPDTGPRKDASPLNRANLKAIQPGPTRQE